MGDWDHNNLIIHELLQGMELARNLQISLHASNSSSIESREVLIQKIIAAFERVLKMVSLKMGLVVGEPSQMHTSTAIQTSEFPLLCGSPHSEDSDKDLRGHDRSFHKKRRIIPSWTKKIRVNPGMGVEGPLDDGYSWRKYGQKDIPGAKYPRGYYRCTHRNVQACMATKQVQRSDEDPTVFEISYRGNHTCTISSFEVPPSEPQENQQPNLSTDTVAHQQSVEQQQSSDLLLNLRPGLRVLTENLDLVPNQPFTSSFHDFPSNIKVEDQVLPSQAIEHNNFAENFNYPSYVSPATSGTSYFSVSTTRGNNLRGQPNLASSGFEINDMISASSSAANSTTVGLEFPFDQFNILDAQNFNFDNPPFS